MQIDGHNLSNDYYQLFLLEYNLVICSCETDISYDWKLAIVSCTSKSLFCTLKLLSNLCYICSVLLFTNENIFHFKPCNYIKYTLCFASSPPSASYSIQLTFIHPINTWDIKFQSLIWRACLCQSQIKLNVHLNRWNF